MYAGVGSGAPLKKEWIYVGIVLEAGGSIFNGE